MNQSGNISRSNTHIESLDLLRFPLAVVVVLVHVFSTSSIHIHGVDYNFMEIPLFAHLCVFVDSFLRQHSVPVYYFISGYMFFYGVEFSRGVYARKLRNRVFTLLIPYIVWNGVAILEKLAFYLPVFSSIMPNLDIATLDFSLSGVLQSFWDKTCGIFPSSPDPQGYMYPQNVALWFLRDMMIVVVCAPLLYGLIKRGKVYFILLLGVAWAVLPSLEWFPPGRAYQLSTAFFFFSFGAYLSVVKRDMMTEFGRFSRSSAVLYVASSLLFMIGTYCGLQWEWLAHVRSVSVLSGLLFSYNIASWLLRKGYCKASRFLVAASFFIYVTQFFYADAFKLCFYLVMPTSGEGTVALILATFVVLIAILLGIFYLMSRYVPRLLCFITGRKLARS